MCTGTAMKMMTRADRFWAVLAISMVFAVGMFGGLSLAQTERDLDSCTATLHEVNVRVGRAANEMLMHAREAPVLVAKKAEDDR